MSENAKIVGFHPLTMKLNVDCIICKRFLPMEGGGIEESHNFLELVITLGD